jgi:RNA polymerase sigma factor (sigma-70 family)
MTARSLRSISRQLDDSEVVRRFRAGDDAAFEEIVGRYRPRLLAFARRLLGNRREDADDVLQEALLRAHRSLRRDDRPINLRAWLFTLTRNCCLDELARRHGDSVDLDAPSAQLALVDPVSPATVVERRAGMREMLDGIACLPATQRHALVRRELDGASHREIAAELGITPLACRSLVHRARQALVAERALTGEERCEAARRDLLRAHHGSARATARTHRHLVTCASCRAYKARVRALRRALNALDPGLGLVFALVAMKGGAAAAKSSGLVAGAAAKVSSTTAGVLPRLASPPSEGPLSSPRASRAP